MNEIDIISHGTITTPKGFLAGAACGGINKHARYNLDVGLLFSQAPCHTAAVFTRNQIKGAAVLLCQKMLPADNIRAVVVNSGCANASTGERGMQDAAGMAAMAAEKLEVSPENVLMSSTGVIGRFLPMEKLKEAIGGIEMNAGGGHDVAKAIMTTDTRPKEMAVSAGGFTIGGIAKGSGMIHPDMATMLCFLTTDADIDSKLLSQCLRLAADKSFNMVSVDGDTSPNDTVLLMANGRSGVQIKEGSGEAALFQQALETVCVGLAKEIARDGEGATKLIEATVSGARTPAEAGIAAVLSLL
jgi:glutamate N-acetyltransferase/amino-acid N-acetyltransferase